MGALAGVTETLGVICVFFPDVIDDIDGPSNMDFCSFLDVAKPRTISSNLRRFFSTVTGGSSTGCNEFKRKFYFSISDQKKLGLKNLGQK